MRNHLTSAQPRIGWHCYVVSLQDISNRHFSDVTKLVDRKPTQPHTQQWPKMIYTLKVYQVINKILLKISHLPVAFVIIK